MVNERLPDTRARHTRDGHRQRRCTSSDEMTQSRLQFAQILHKLNFVELSENFALILFDYGQKRPRSANRNFKPPCYVVRRYGGRDRRGRAYHVLSTAPRVLARSRAVAAAQRRRATRCHRQQPQHITSHFRCIGDRRRFTWVLCPPTRRMHSWLASGDNAWLQGASGRQDAL
jgi:hypothetical protein